MINLILDKNLFKVVPSCAHLFSISDTQYLLHTQNRTMLLEELRKLNPDNYAELWPQAFYAGYRFCIEQHKLSSEFVKSLGAKVLNINGKDYAVGAEHILQNLAITIRDIDNDIDPITKDLYFDEMLRPRGLAHRVSNLVTSINIQTLPVNDKALIVNVVGSDERFMLVESQDETSFYLGVDKVFPLATFNSSVIDFMAESHDRLMENSEFVDDDEDELEEVQLEIESLLGYRKVFKEARVKRRAFISVSNLEEGSGFDVTLYLSSQHSNEGIEISIASVMFSDEGTRLINKVKMEDVEVYPDWGDDEVYSAIVDLIIDAVAAN